MGTLASDVHIWFTTFIGREREVTDICALLARSDVRLVTLTGPGGVGKTRLAFTAGIQFEAASGQRIFVVDLSSINDPDLVLLAIAQSVGVRETGNEPIEVRVAEALNSESSLLVLDNFEHLIEAATLLPSLLVSCPSLSVLVTSRERLRLTAEYEFEVHPLALPDMGMRPDIEGLRRSEAVRLFVERAQAVSSDFALTDANAGTVAGICARLDGLPLALELAAARVKALSLSALHERLDRALPLLTQGARDLPARQQTMRDAIAWSYDLLSPHEQRIFRRLSVFRGGCNLLAAEVVSNDVDATETLIGLVERSLIGHDACASGDSRFRMLEPVRQFGELALEESGERDDVYHCHARYFLTLAEGEQTGMPSPADFDWIDRMSADRENLRLALDTLWRLRDDDGFVRLAASHTDFWQACGSQEEASLWLNRALERGARSGPHVLARICDSLGIIAWARGEYAKAAPLFEQELRFAEASGDMFWIATALGNSGGLAYRTGSLERAATEIAAAAQLFHDLPGSVPAAAAAEANAFSLLGDTKIMQGQYDLAASYLERSIAMNRSFGWKWALTDALGGLGVVKVEGGEFRQAAACYLEAFDLSADTLFTGHMVSVITGLAAVAAGLGQLERSARLLGAAGRYRQDLGVVVYPRDQAMLDRCIDRARAYFDEPRFAVLQLEGSSWDKAQLRGEVHAILAIEERAGSNSSSGTLGPFGLTPREVEVLQLLVERRTDKEIAEALFVSRRTVTTHTSSIFGKLGVGGRREAAEVAVRRGLV
jgi:non-specific serine/threonine protein kinase